MHDNKSISLSILNQIPEFIQESNPLFQKFMEGYYRSQEKIGGPLNIINNLTNYMNIDSYNLKKLDGNTQIIIDIDSNQTDIQVENVDGFLDEDGTLLIDNEIIYYKELRKSPSITFSPSISFSEFVRKKIILSNPYQQFNGVKKDFKLVSNDEPVFPTSSKHLIVKLYGDILVPDVDYQVLNDNIIFTVAPREFDSLVAGDDAIDISLEYLKGFETTNIITSNVTRIDSNKFRLRENNLPLIPTSDILLIVILDNKLLRAYKDYSTFEDTIILNESSEYVPYVYFINFTTTSIGNGCIAYSLVNNDGQVESIAVKQTGSGYSFNNEPKVSLSKGNGQYATARALVDGIKTITLLEGGSGYSKINPPVIRFQKPQNPEGIAPEAHATVNDSGAIESITLKNSGSGYDSIPRIQFANPSGAEVGNVSVNPDNGQITGVQVISPGFGYTVAPEIYIDAPTDENGIPALLQGILDVNGELSSVEIINAGRGYSASNLPRVRVIQPTGAQVLDVSVDSFGRVISIELLSGGSGYTNVPSVYIVDDRKDNIGNPIGGTGAKAVATVFNNEITDISITEFGTGYSSSEPPKIYISAPDSAKASATIGRGEITGINVINSGSNYTKSEFIGCSRGVSGIVDYTEDNNAIFVSESESVPVSHKSGSLVKSLDSVFFAKVIDRIVEQYLPGLPKIPLENINIANILKTAKDFYASKGTQFSLRYLFNVLYGVPIEISYPKDQIIKPSAASWSVDTIMRARLISGNPINLTNGLIEQIEDPIDTNVKYATGLIENYIAIQTPNYDVYELTLSEESLSGEFVIPYKTKLTERIGAEDIIITVDSTIGWPDKNGEIVIGSEVIRYREKSLTQFIECTRGVSGVSQEWDSGTDCSSNFYIYVNKGTPQEVVLSILGIIEANKTTLLDDGRYYLPGDKLNISKLGSTEDIRLLDSWLYNVKKLLKVDQITFGGQNNRTATVVCENPHGLLIGDQFTIYGANPIIFNGSFLVTSIPTRRSFTYELPQPANINPQGNILASIDLNKGKSNSTSINSAISRFASNVQNSFFNNSYVYIAASGIPNYKIGPFIGTALLPGNQRKLNRFPKTPITISLKEETKPGAVGTFVNGVSAWNYKSPQKFSYGPLTKVNILNGGKNYDAIVPPKLTISGNGQEALGRVIVDGSIVEIEVTSGGSGYTTSPLVSISGGGGDGATATAIVTNGLVSRILVNTPGSGFTTRPTVNIIGGGGDGATANAIVRGSISEVVIENAGKDFTTPPSISLSSGSGAAAEAFVSNGRITSVAVIASGAGYTTAPNVIITGDGFGAIGRATISTEGIDAGRVTGITILNRGVGYRPGTTQIRLESVGEGAIFQAQIFQWTFNLESTLTFDSANGTIFEGYNKQFGGEYGHVANPKQLRFVLGDNLTVLDNNIIEKDSGLVHSPIIGWAFDGNPIYGPYGFVDPTNINSGITPVKSGYALKENLVFNEVTNPNPERIDGPLLEQFPAGTFVEDYEYVFKSEAIFLDEYNGRFTKTPEFPDGIYAYFITLNTDGTPAFPYIVGGRFYSQPDSWNFNQFATQSNIPSGIVRYRDPFENVDIDIERQSNEITNLITLEDGNFLTFEIEDLNKDGFISEEEMTMDIFILEESKLEIFDYFPRIEVASKVDIEVETTTRFEDAKITEFLIENPGVNYQVGDSLVFDNAGTEGSGASASVSKIIGENVVNYTYRYNEELDSFEGIVTTDTQHNLEVGDRVEVTTQPQMEPVSKVIKMITITGLEKISVERTGIGYSDDIPVDIEIESETGQDASVVASISSTGVFEDVKIVNSGNSYTDVPRIRVSHPQIRSRSNYFTLGLSSGEEIKITNSLVLDNKEFYAVGSIKSTNGNINGFVAKFNSEGFLLWRKTLVSVQPDQELKTCQFNSITKDGNSIYVVGTTRPNPALSNSFNPDIILVKLTDNTSSAVINWQRQYGGISGASREDYATDITIYNGNILLCGYTTTNSNHTNDAIVMYIASNGDTLTRRKITSPSSEDKFYQIKVNSKGEIFLLGTTVGRLYLSKVDIIGNRIIVSSTKTITRNDTSFQDLTMIIDEYDDIYITGTQKTVSTNISNKFFIVRLDTNQNIKWANSYTISQAKSLTTSKSSIDVFGEINIACSVTAVDDLKYVITSKINYLGNVVRSNELKSIIHGYEVSSCISDSSGDPVLFGNYFNNTTEFLFDGSSFSDKLDKISDLAVSGTVSLVTDSKYGDSAFSLAVSGRLRAETNLTSAKWTIEGWFKYDSIPTTKIHNLLTVTDGTNTIIVQVQGTSSNPTTYGKIRTEVNGTAGGWSTQSNVLTLMNGNYAHFKLTKSIVSEILSYSIYMNGVQYTQQSSTVGVEAKQVDIGNITASSSVAMKVDEIRLSNFDNTSSTIPSEELFPYSYRTANSYVLKLDKNSDFNRLGFLEFENSNLSVQREFYQLSGTSFEPEIANYTLASEGFQILDYSDVLSFLLQDTENISTTLDIWSSRTATVPSPGGRKPLISSKAYDKFFFRTFSISRIDNIRQLTINQPFKFNEGTNLIQKNSLGVPVSSGKIVSIDAENNFVYVSLVNGTFSLNSGTLESSDNAVNEISNYVFANQDASSPGTFTITIPAEIDAVFKEYSDDDYQIRIDDVISGSPYSRGSVVVLGSSFFSFTSDRKQVTIDGLTAVTQISLLTNLKKVLQITDISNTSRLFVNTASSHYLNSGDIIYLESAPEYSQTNGTYFIDTVLNKKQFIFTLRTVPETFIGSGSAFSIFAKHPVINLIYGQQYAFDTSDPSNIGHFLSFYRDNLNRIEYTFKNIVRQGVPGVDQPGVSPFIAFKVTDDVSNISYYNDPSKSSDESPVGENSYIDVLPSPYIGSFEVKELGGATVTTGANQLIFPLRFDPEKAAIASLSSYTTTSRKAVGSIGQIRLINGGGFYKKLPVITGFESIRKIERVEIINPGTEYQPGEYFSVPISGNGAGGRVRITVDATTDPPGQIVEVVITDPGKGYTNAFIDVDAIPGILGPQLTGSGASLNVIIPPRGTGASVFVKGNNVGKIKKLKNNNFGFDYTHDYTLRPEITFPVNLQLVSTSVLSNINVVDPGTGYTSPPEVDIIGGGGSGAEAEAILRNGRINAIIIKSPGSGYTTSPTIELKSSFTYVVNLDLQLFQFAIPHGIPNGAEVKFDVRDLGEGTDFPLTSFGFINPNQTYYAIAGQAAGLEDDQLRIALTPGDSSTGNFIFFVNNGNGRQIILTDSFGGKAEAILETARFLSGEKVYQGISIETATAEGFVSENDGWQVGPRLLKLVDYTGDFKPGEVVTGLISKASGVISDISIARGVLEVDSTTTTPGKFLDDVGKTSEIIQKVQDSYLYQSFSYNIKSPISIDEWKNIVIDNVHPAGFKVFGEIGITGEDQGISNKTDFELVKSVNLIESSVVSHIDNFALSEPIYSEFDNTQVLFRNKRLTSSEEILTSVVQKIDDISNLFDGERVVFPLTIDGTPVVAQTSQFMITINGVVQAPGKTFNVQQGNIIFNEPPSAPTKVSYAIAELDYEQTTLIELNNISGIIPEIGNTIRGLSSNATATVVSSTSTSLTVFNITGTFLVDEVIISAATGLNANIVSIDIIETNNVFRFREKITNLRRKTAVIEEINLDVQNNILTNTIVISKTSGTYDSPSGLLDIRINDFIISADTGIVAKVVSLSPYTDPNTYIVINSDYSFIGDFQVGETVVGSTSGSIGEVIFWNPSIKRLILKTTSGSFVPNEVIIGQISEANHKILTTTKIDPVSSISISDPSKFYGLLFNRIVNPLNPNTIVDDISKSVIEVVDLEDPSIKVENIFAEFEEIQNTLLTYDAPTSDLVEDEFIQNIKIKYTNETDDFQEDENIEVRKLTYYDLSNGNFQLNDNLTGSSSGTIGKVIGVNYALKTLYIGNKVGNFITGETISTDKSIMTVNDIVSGRNADASDLILGNKQLIAEVAVGRMLNNFPGFSIPGGNQNCIDDIISVLEEICFNIKYGGNHRAYDVGVLYITNNYLDDERDESAYAFAEARDMAIQAMRNEDINLGGYTTLTQFKDLTVIGDLSQEPGVYNPGDCANIESAIEVLFGIVLQAIGTDATPGNLGGITRVNAGSVLAKVSSYFIVPFAVKQLDTSEKLIVSDQVYTDSQHRFRDAANLLRLNSSYIIDEAAGRLKNRYPDLVIPGDSFGVVEGTNRCKLDLSLLLQAVILDLENGGNYESVTAARFYLDSNGGLRFIERQVLQSVYAHTQMNELCQLAVIGELSDNPEYTNRFSIPPISVTNDPGDCVDVRAQIDTLWNYINDVISPTGDVYRDAGDLIWFNKNFIADETIAHIDSEFTFILNGVQYRAFEYPNGSSATCKRDLVEFILPSIIADLVSGGDVNTINAMKFYINANNEVEYIKNELLPTIVALEKANELCQYAINNWIVSDNIEYNSQYNVSTAKYKDTSITIDDGTYGGSCANIKSAIDILFQKAIDILLPATQEKRDAAKLIMFNKRYIQNESLQRMLNNFPGFQVPGGNSKCLRDIGYIIDAIVYDLLTDGNSAIYNASTFYIDPETGTVSSLEGELIQSIYAYNQVRELMNQSVAETLPSPAPATGFISYTDSTISIIGSALTSIQTFIDTNMQILLGTLNNVNYIDVNSIEPFNSIIVPDIAYPVRDPLTPVKGNINSGDYIYGTQSNQYGEISSIQFNRARVKTILKKFRLTFENDLQKYDVNDVLTVVGNSSKSCKVYSTYYSETVNYIDVEIISGVFSLNDIILNDDGYRSTIIDIDNAIQLTNTVGSFDFGDYFRAPKSNTEAFTSAFELTSSPVFSNTGGNLELDTSSMIDRFNVSNVVYSTTSTLYVDTIGFEGTQVRIGDLVRTTITYKITLNLTDDQLSVFTVGQYLQNFLNSNQKALILNVNQTNLTTVEILISNITGQFNIGDAIAYYLPGNVFPDGYGVIAQITTQSTPAYGFVERIIQIGATYRLYLSSTNGTFENYSQLIANDYRSGILDSKEIVGRVSRSFRGFDGTQTTFKLTSNNGTPYFPDSDGHVLVFVNGILQPVGTSYNTFSDIIEFLEAPELGASFHATYIGKLRKLDDLSFEFDSLRSSFNLRLNEVFYSLTITDGVQSTNIRPENNIIVSLNGVIQEPGVSFEIVGSRINFAEVPRAGSTFVAYSYIGSDADVIAATVIPPIESGDQLLIESEDRDRTVAIVESSNSLITFDYQGSVFGRNASALANLITGRIRSIQLTSGGDGYTSTPTVSLSSPTGFDGSIKAQVGISRVDVVERGSGYKYPEIEIVTEVPELEDTSTFDSSSATFDISFITFDAS
jgi:hypothetical protein